MLGKSKIFVFFLLQLFTIIGYSQSNEGTSFWCTFMPHVDALLNQKVIMITSKYNTTGEINAKGVGLSKKFNVVANSVTVIKVPETIELVDAEITTAQGIQITTQLPCSVYIHQYSDFRSEASLVLPENALGTAYYAMAYFGKYSRNQVYPSQFSIIGTQDNTSVTIRPSANTKSGFLKDQLIRIIINKGDTYMVQASSENEDITGSYISSDKSIAVFAGNPWTGVPQDCSNWDNLLEQMVPINAWGKKFISAPSAFTSYDLYRILASEDNTKVLIDGNPTILNQGQYYEYKNSNASYITADKPIMVAQYLIGGKCNGHDVGDPSMLVLNSIEQNRDTIILYNSDLQTITENFVNLIVQTDDIDNTTIDGVAIKNLVVNSGKVSGSAYSFFSLKVNAGSHLIINKGCGVIASAYGYGSAESYAYGGGANFRPLNAAPIIEGACLNDTVTFDARLDSTKVRITWDFGDGSSSSLHKPSHTYKMIGKYNVSLIVENLCLNISDTIKKEINISSRRNIKGPNDALICEKDSITLEAFDPNANATYLWNYPDGSQSKDQAIKITNASLKDQGSYSVIGIVAGCATSPSTAEIKISPLPIVSLGNDTTYCIEDPPFTLTIPQFEDIIWSNGENSNSILITKAEALSVIVTDGFGCKNSDDKSIKAFCPTKLYLPNVFSPNNDGVNDFFEPIGVNITNYKIEVFDRWGNLVFTGQKWDGLSNGKKVAIGVYAYVITYNEALLDGIYSEKVTIGDILIVR